jgi:hypothetical protein
MSNEKGRVKAFGSWLKPGPERVLRWIELGLWRVLQWIKQSASWASRLASASAKWVFIFFLFIYLLALAMALFEVEGLQKMAGRLSVVAVDPADTAGIARQRSVLLALQEQDRLDGGQGSGIREQILSRQVAARLDKLEAAITGLDSTANGAANSGASLAFKGLERQQTGRDTYLELVANLRSTIDDIKHQIAEQPAVCKEDALNQPDPVFRGLPGAKPARAAAIHARLKAIEPVKPSEVEAGVPGWRTEAKAVLEAACRVSKLRSRLGADLQNIADELRREDDPKKVARLTALQGWTQDKARATESLDALVDDLLKLGRETSQTAGSGSKETCTSACVEAKNALETVATETKNRVSDLLPHGSAAVPDNHRCRIDNIAPPPGGRSRGLPPELDGLVEGNDEDWTTEVEKWRHSAIELEDWKEETSETISQHWIALEDQRARYKAHLCVTVGSLYKVQETLALLPYFRVARTAPGTGAQPGEDTAVANARRRIQSTLQSDAEQFNNGIRYVGGMYPLLIQLLQPKYKEGDLATELMTLDRTIESLRTLADQAKITSVFQTEAHESEPETGKTGKREPIPALETGQTPSDDRLREILVRLDPKESDAAQGADRKAIVRKLQVLAELTGDDLDGVIGGTSRPKINELIEVYNQRLSNQPESSTAAQGGEKEDTSEQRWLKESLAGLRQSLSQIRAWVNRFSADETNRHVLELTGPIAAMDGAAYALANIEIKVNPDPEAPAEDGEKGRAARAEFNRAMVSLRDGLEELKKELEADDSTVTIAQTIGADGLAYQKAATLIREYLALEKYQPILTPLAFLRPPGVDSAKACATAYADLAQASADAGDVATAPKPPPSWIEKTGCVIAGVGIQPKTLATLSRQNLDLMIVFVMGAIGSLIFITQYHLKLLLAGQNPTARTARTFWWYFFRPVFGIVIAFAIYLLYKTGQVALGGGTSNVLASDVNLPILSLVSLFAGLLSWQALDVIETRGSHWLSSQKRENLYATGLEQALRRAGRTPEECAKQIGRTTMQIHRWITGTDKVIPEMQDRIVTWLDRPRTELFSDVKPEDVQNGRLRWATGLAAALDSPKRSLDTQTLAVLIGQDRETVEGWRDLRIQISPAMQMLVAEKLDMPPDALFSDSRPDADWWAVGLRAALEGDNTPVHNAEALAQTTQLAPETIHAYMELEKPVPLAIRESVANTLGLPSSQLFANHRPRNADYRWAVRLRSCMEQSVHKRAADLADAVDTDIFRVRAWMEQDQCNGDAEPFCGQVTPATQRRIAAGLGCSVEDIFSTERQAALFKWTVSPLFEHQVREAGGVRAFAEAIDVEPSRVDQWIAGSLPVAPETQQAIILHLRPPAALESSLFETKAMRKRKRLDADWWAVGLRAAVAGADSPFESLAELANRAGLPVTELQDYAELIAPVPAQTRQDIALTMGVEGERLFSTQRPDPKDFLWAPGLRAQMRRNQMDAAELADLIDADVARVRGWMEQDPEVVGAAAEAIGIARGQVGPATRALIAEKLGCSEGEIFTPTRSTAGYRWPILPIFEDTVQGYDGGRLGFAEEFDVPMERLERWLAWEEPVSPGTQAAITEALGLESADLLFADEKQRLDTQG